MRVANRKLLYNNKDLQFVVVQHENQTFDMIVERTGNRDFGFYYHTEDIPDGDTRREIEDFLYHEFLDWRVWDLYNREIH